MNNRRLVSWLVILAVAFVVVLNFSQIKSWISDSSDPSPSQDTKAVDTSSWREYQNNEFGFSLKYPADKWKMVEAPDHLNGLAPKFNFYLPSSTSSVKTPLTHFSNITNVSVFPEGIPTEGLMGQTKQLDSNWGEGVSSESRIHVMEDGTPFAAYIKYENTPESWNDSGFVWARLHSSNLRSVCFRNGEEMSEDEQCDPLGNESITIRHRGDVNQELWPILREVVRGLEFSSSQ